MSISNAYGGTDIPVTVSDASASEFRFMTGDTTDATNLIIAVKLATAETTPPLGILQEPTTSVDVEGTLRIAGTSMLKVNGNSHNIDINDELVSAADGIGVLFSTPDAAVQYVGAIALGVSVADGDLILVKVVGPQRVVKGTA